jgi:membrane fusion protein, multidrug efflux system
VKVGVRQLGKVEVVSGLQAGDVVVTAGQQRITKDGTPVRVLEMARAPGQPAANGAAATRTAGGPAAAVAEVVPSTAGNPCAVSSGAPRAAGRRG